MKSKVFSRRYFDLGDGLKFNGVAGIPKDTMKVGRGLLHAPPHTHTHTHTDFELNFTRIIFVYSTFVHSGIEVYSLNLLNHFIKGLTTSSCQLSICPIWSFEFVMHFGKRKSSSFKCKAIN